MHIPRAVLSLVMTTTLLLFASTASAATLYVDGGSIGGTCSDSRTLAQVTRETPLCTIPRGSALAPSGSTVYVRGGDYPYADIAHQTSRTDYATVEPYNGEAVTIAGVRTANAKFVRIKGMHITGRMNIYLQSSNIEVIDNDISVHGISSRGPVENVLIEGNWVHDITRDCAQHEPNGFGIFLAGGGTGYIKNVTVRNNTIEGTPQDALNLGGSGLENIDVVGNNIASATTSQCGDHTDALQINGGTNLKFRNNIFRDSNQVIIHQTKSGLEFTNNLFLRINNWMQLYASPGARIINNTWYGGNQTMTGAGSLILRNDRRDPWPMTGVVIKNNIFKRFAGAAPPAQYVEDNNIVTDLDRSRSSGISNSRTIFSAVTFRDAAAGDFRLAPTSAGIDAGDATAALPFDFFGRPRWDDPLVSLVDGSAVDIGAFEFWPDGVTPEEPEEPTPDPQDPDPDPGVEDPPLPDVDLPVIDPPTGPDLPVIDPPTDPIPPVLDPPTGVNPPVVDRPDGGSQPSTPPATGAAPGTTDPAPTGADRGGAGTGSANAGGTPVTFGTPLSLSFGKKATLTSGRAEVTATCSASCTVKVTAALVGTTRSRVSYSLPVKSVRRAKAGRLAIVLRLPRAVRSDRAIRQLVRAHAPVLKIAARVTDASGRVTTRRQTLKVRVG